MSNSRRLILGAVLALGIIATATPAVAATAAGGVDVETSALSLHLTTQIWDW